MSKKVLAVISIIAVVLVLISGVNLSKPLIKTASDFYESIEVPYPMVNTPVLYNNKIIMAAAKPDATDIICRYIVEYDIETGESEVLFESTQTGGHIQQMQINESWVLWNDVNIYGGAPCYFYVMNLESGEIKLAGNTEHDAIPSLMDDCVYWMDRTKTENNISSGHIYRYNCLTEKTDTIADVTDVNALTVSLSSKEGKVVWNDIEGEINSIYIFDSATEETSKIDTPYKYIISPSYHDGNVVFVETENIKDSSVPRNFQLYNIKKETYTNLNLNNRYRINILEEYAVISASHHTWIYRYDNGKLEPIKALIDKAEDFTVSTDNIVINVVPNYNMNTGVLSPVTELHILRLNELKNYRIDG